MHDSLQPQTSLLNTGLDILSACSERILVLNMLGLIYYPCVGHRMTGSEQPACAWGSALVNAQTMLRFDGSHVVRYRCSAGSYALPVLGKRPLPAQLSARLYSGFISWVVSRPGIRR